MTLDEQILRRHFIAIATGTYAASGTYPALDVDSEVACVRGWLADTSLADRRFDDAEFSALAHDPSYDQVKAGLNDQRQFTDADAVVVYVTGHGATLMGAHRIVLSKTDPQAPAEAIRTVELVEWLAAHRTLEQVLLVIDVCDAGQLLTDMTGELRRMLPPPWIALLTAPASTGAKLGAFAGVLQSVVDDFRAAADEALRCQPYLESYRLIAAVKDRLRDVHKQELVVLTDPYRPSVCLPNPGYDAARYAPVVASSARRDLAIPPEDMASHWEVRAPLTAGAGPVFTGRARLLQELIAFCAGPPGTLVVGGRAGCGKSAALARLVTCSDADFRSRYRSVLERATPVPSEDAVDVAVLATGKTAEQIAQQVGRALGVQRRNDARTALEGWIAPILDAVHARPRPLTVVIDALDEAADPSAVLRGLLQQLVAGAPKALRLLVGVRSSGGGPASPGDGAARPGDLAALVTGALGARQIRADHADFWEPKDLQAYIEQVLTQPGTAYDAASAALVAAVAGELAGRSYLVAGLTARALAELDRAPSVVDVERVAGLAGGLGELVAADLHVSLPSTRERRRALTLLRAAALAEGRGIPAHVIWPRLATAISPDGTVFGDSDVSWLLRHRVSGYLVRDVEDDVPVYRPFHDELRRVLAVGLVVDGDGFGAMLDVSEAQQRITNALLPLARWEAA